MEVFYPDSNRIGKLLIKHETLRDDRAMIGALFAMCTMLEAWPHESGRGIEFIIACAAFEELREREEIPHYRVEFVYDGGFANPECERRRVESGRFGFAFFRQIVVRVPAVELSAAARVPAMLH